MCSENYEADKDLFGFDVTIFDAQNCDEDGKFNTEPLAPGKYALVVKGYEAIPSSALNRTGIIRPKYTDRVLFEIPETGEPAPLEISLEPAKNDVPNAQP